MSEIEKDILEARKLVSLLYGDSQPVTTGPLTPTESVTLAACEAAIEEHIGAWVNVTNALTEIAQRRLYRETHPTFEAYCAERWGLSRSHGHRLVLLGQIQMSPVGDRIRNERQAREIASLLDDPDLLRLVVERAEEIREGKSLTAAALRQARAELTLKPEEVEIARRVYRAAEWTEERLAAWQEDAARIASKYIAALPPGEMGWGHNLVQKLGKGNVYASDEKAGTAVAFALAMDAPLTEEVCLLIRQHRAEVISKMSNLVEAVDHGADTFATIGSAAPVGEPFTEVATALRKVVPLLAERMAEVLVAVAETQPGRAWSPAEVEQAKAAFTEDTEQRAAAGKIRDWARGPLLDSFGQITHSLHDTLTELQAKLDERKKP